MTIWKEKLVSMFVPGIKPVVIAYDENNLLTEESIITALKNNGFIVILSGSLLHVRAEFEKYIENIRRGENSETLLIIHQQESSFSIPYDISKNAEIVNVSFDTLFPNLSASVLNVLSSEQFADVYDAYEDEKPAGQLGYDRTCLFLLKNLFRIHPQEIKTDNDLISLLLKVHFEGIKIPKPLSVYFSEYLNAKRKYSHWSGISDLLSENDCFWKYLQDAWDNTLTGSSKKTLGPSVVDFTQKNISIYIDDAFDTGLLHITTVDSSVVKPAFIPENLFELSRQKNSKEFFNRERSIKLKKQLNNELPTVDSSFFDWVSFQRAFSEYMFLNSSVDNQEIFNKVNPVFVQWVAKHYDSLSFETGRTPVMLPKIIEYLRREKNNGIKKIALLVLDGMSYSQWLAIKSVMTENDDFSYEENTSLACIPTLTSVSRQSIFSGMYPRFYSSSIYKTSEEPKLWSKSWQDICNALYLKNNGTGKADEVLEQIVPSTQVVGIVLNTIDDIMHGTILGNTEFYERIKLWMKQCFLSDLISGLFDMGFQIWVTSDHGNIESTGIGSIKTGQLAETKGARTFILPSDSLRNQFVAENEFSFVWNSKLLPEENYSVLVADGNKSFIKKDEKEISHGGISIEEVMVPFVRIMRRKKN